MDAVSLLGLILASVATTLTGAYWGGLIIGGGLLLISVLSGGHGDADLDIDAGLDGDLDLDLGADSDLDVDLGHDIGVDAGADLGHAAHGAADGAAALATWFSMRFLVFFAATFGGVGLILTCLTPLGVTTTFLLASSAGVVVGQGVHQLFRYIRRTSGNSTPQAGDYVHRLARVTIAIRHPDKGEVALQVRGTERFIPAVAGGAISEFGSGEEVVVVGYRAGVARVVSREEFERRLRAH